MSQLVTQAAENDNISTIFVINDAEEFYGAIDLKDLIIARQNHPLEISMLIFMHLKQEPIERLSLKIN